MDASAARGLFWIDTGRTASRVAAATLSRPMPKEGAPVRLRAVSIAGSLVEQILAEPSSRDNALGSAVWDRRPLAHRRRQRMVRGYLAPRKPG